MSLYHTYLLYVSLVLLDINALKDFTLHQIGEVFKTMVSDT